ncbi:hypothetical protein [Hyalangium rubrum]|uniref:Uncharacterized protein n=1 Tax=Hyalangium rubrum TaxID=3103134 RepID=A0ABU5GVV6_9BACT|nr:hypothetical protein [Hyalangium sp. s54d21]MDY7224849.1 hypothetical protein [Hyalangium sp. s54d21]
MSHSNRHSPGSFHRPRLLALPLVVLCALAYLGDMAHFTLVQHTTCLEHGEVIHVGEEGLHEQPAGVVLASSDAEVSISRAGPAAMASHDAEAHCAHTFFRRETLTPAVETLLTVEALAVSSPAPMLEQVHPEPVARLRLAPKSSPPLS